MIFKMADQDRMLNRMLEESSPPQPPPQPLPQPLPSLATSVTKPSGRPADHFPDVEKTTPPFASATTTSATCTTATAARIFAPDTARVPVASSLTITSPPETGSPPSAMVAPPAVAHIKPETQMQQSVPFSAYASRNSCKTLKCPKCNWHYKVCICYPIG